MSGLQCLTAEKIWFDKRCYDEAERRFYEGVNGPSKQHQQVTNTAFVKPSFPSASAAFALGWSSPRGPPACLSSRSSGHCRPQLCTCEFSHSI